MCYRVRVITTSTEMHAEREQQKFVFVPVCTLLVLIRQVAYCTSKPGCYCIFTIVRKYGTSSVILLLIETSVLVSRCLSSPEYKRCNKPPKNRMVHHWRFPTAASSPGSLLHSGTNERMRNLGETLHNLERPWGDSSNGIVGNVGGQRRGGSGMFMHSPTHHVS